MAMAVRRHIHAAAVFSVRAAAIVAARLRASRRDGRLAGGGGQLERGAGPCAVSCHDYTYITQPVRKITQRLRKNFYASITHNSSYTNFTQIVYAAITQALCRNYANKLRTLRKYYAEVTQIIYAIIKLRNH